MLHCFSSSSKIFQDIIGEKNTNGRQIHMRSELMYQMKNGKVDDDIDLNFNLM